MAIQIQFRRGTALEWTTANPILADGEMAIETDTSLFKVGNGVDRWNTLAYGGLRGFAGSQGGAGYTGSAGSGIVSNVMYVSKSGNDLNAGDSLVSSKLTIRSALATATYGTTIFVKSGDYTEINPRLPTNPVAPLDPVNPVPADPTNPTDPVNPRLPVNPTPLLPVNPIEPV